MHLNIKNPSTHALAARLARRLDTSMAHAVTVALEDKLARTETKALMEARIARLLSGANAIAARLTPEQKTMDVAVELYDADGMPK